MESRLTRMEALNAILGGKLPELTSALEELNERKNKLKKKWGYWRHAYRKEEQAKTPLEQALAIEMLTESSQVNAAGTSQAISENLRNMQASSQIPFYATWLSIWP